MAKVRRVSEENPFNEAVNQRRWLMREIGKRIKAKREDGGWTQEDVSAETGISRPQFGNIESGRALPSLMALYEIAASLDCNARDLIP